MTLHFFFFFFMDRGPLAGVPSHSTTWRQTYRVRSSCPERVPEVPVGWVKVDDRVEVKVGLYRCP